MPKSSNKGIYAFDEFRLDAEKLMLYRDEAEISLPPKVVKTLAVLVESEGSILSKDELIERVWADSIVEESNLSQYLYLLRKTVGHRPDGQPYIETLRRRGYRFNGDVRQIEAQIPKQTNGGGNGAVQPPRTSIERQGNVLRLVDWNAEADRPATSETIAATEKTVEGSIESDVSSKTAIVAIGLAVAALLAAGTAILIWYKSAPIPAAVESKGELTFRRLTNGAVPNSAAISPDGDYIVYHEIDGDTARMFVQQVEQAARVEIASSSEKMFEGKTFTPDGRFVYFIAVDKAGGQKTLFRVPTIGGPQTKIASGVVYPVSFSPDGEEMVFLRLNQATGESSLNIADKDGRNERTILKRENPYYLSGTPAWSPDGKLIAYAEIDLSGASLTASNGLLAVDPSTGEIQKISDERWSTLYGIAWLRDGKGLVVIATRINEAYSTRRDQVYYISYPAGASRRITTDGNRHDPITLSVTKDNAVIAIPYNRSSQIWSMNPNGDPGTAVQISKGLADGRAGLGVMPDGRVGYITRTGDELHVWVMNADGTNAKQLSSDFPVAEELRADPQGRFFVFSTVKDDHINHLFRIDADGGNLKQLTFGDGYEIDSTISPDGNWIVFDSTVFKGSAGSRALWKIPSDGGEPLRFFDDCSTPNYSPDGQFVSCVRAEKEIIILSAADGSLIDKFKLPPYTTINFGALWTPDSRGLIFIKAEKDTWNLWVQPTEGGKPSPLTKFNSGLVYRYAFSNDGARLYVARGYPINDVVLIKNFR